MQSKMAEMNDRLAAAEIEGVAGGGLVRVLLNGKCEMKRVATRKNHKCAAEVVR